MYFISLIFYHFERMNEYSIINIILHLHIGLKVAPPFCQSPIISCFSWTSIIWFARNSKDNNIMRCSPFSILYSCQISPQVRKYEREFLRNIRNWQRLDFLFLLLLLDYVFWKKNKAAKKISYVKLLVSPWTTEIRHSDKVWEKRMRYKVGIFIMVWRAHGFSEVCKLILLILPTLSVLSVQVNKRNLS